MQVALLHFFCIFEVLANLYFLTNRLDYAFFNLCDCISIRLKHNGALHEGTEECPYLMKGIQTSKLDPESTKNAISDVRICGYCSKFANKKYFTTCKCCNAIDYCDNQKCRAADWERHKENCQIWATKYSCEECGVEVTCYNATCPKCYSVFYCSHDCYEKNAGKHKYRCFSF